MGAITTAILGSLAAGAGAIGGTAAGIAGSVTASGALSALGALGAASSIKGGLEAKDAAGEQARLARSDAAARAAETDRVPARSSELESRNIQDTLDRQKLAFLASGVTLEGSPLLVMEETRKRGAENIDEIEKAGKAGSEAQLAEGRRVAQSAKSSGRQAMIGGITGAAGSLSRLA